MKNWIVAVLCVIVVTGVACGAGEPPAETPTPTELSTPPPSTPTATPSPTPMPTPTATPTPTLTPTATPEPSRGDYCGRLNTARERLRRAEITDESMELNALAVEIDSGLAAHAWEKLDNDPERRDAIASDLARKIRLARMIIDIDPHPSLDFLHYEVATAVDSYIDVTEALELAISGGGDLPGELARNFFLTMFRGQIAALRMIGDPRCPF